MPVDLVTAEESQVHPAVAGAHHVIAHVCRPVLVVPEREDCAGSVEQVRIGVQVHVGGVAKPMSGPLGEQQERKLEVQEVAGARHGVGRIGAVEADRPGALGVLAGGTAVEAVAAPRVVGLPGGDRVDDHDPSLVRGSAHRQRHKLLGAVCPIEADQVVAGLPAAGVQRQRRLPRRHDRVGGLLHHVVGLLDARLGGRPPDLQRL